MPIISTAPSVREAAAGFEALLFSQALAPLAKSMGFYGDTMVEAAVRTIARNEHGGLVDRLERALESASQRSLAGDAG